MQKDFKDIGDLLVEVIRDVTANLSSGDTVGRNLEIEVRRSKNNEFHFKGVAPRDNDASDWKKLNFKLKYD